MDRRKFLLGLAAAPAALLPGKAEASVELPEVKIGEGYWVDLSAYFPRSIDCCGDEAETIERLIDRASHPRPAP